MTILGLDYYFTHAPHLKVHDTGIPLQIAKMTWTHYRLFIALLLLSLWEKKANFPVKKKSDPPACWDPTVTSYPPSHPMAPVFH